MINELSVLEFNHKLECLELEQSITTQLIQYQFMTLNESSNYDVVHEGVLETIKNAVMAIFKKIKEFLNSVVSFFRKQKGKEDNVLLDKEIKKAEKVVKDIESGKTQKDQGSKQNNDIETDDKTANAIKNVSRNNAQIALLPSFTERTIEIFQCTSLTSLDPVTTTLNNCDLLKKIKDTRYFAVSANKRPNSRNVEISKDKVSDAYRTQKQNKNKYDICTDFYSCFISYLNINVNRKFELNKDIISFPSDALEKIKDEYRKKEERTYTDYSKMKDDLLFFIDRAKHILGIDCSKDIENARGIIAKQEEFTKKQLSQQNLKGYEAEGILFLVNLLSTLLNNVVPVTIRIWNMAKNNVRYNLAVYNKLLGEV